MSRAQSPKDPPPAEPTGAPAADPPSAPAPTESSRDALSRGIEEATAPPRGAPPEPPSDPPDDDPGAAPAAESALPAAAAPKPAAAPAPKPAEPPTSAEAKAAEEEAALAAEVKAYKLGSKAETRFRALAADARDLKALRAQMESAGFKDSSKALPELLQRAQDYAGFAERIHSTGVSSEDFGRTLDLLGDMTKAGRGDVEAATRAYEALAPLVQGLGVMIGKESSGADPLAGHADLQREVEAGELTRERAAEVARARAANVAQARARATGTAVQEKDARELRGRSDLNRLGADLARTDTDYARKAPLLLELLREVLPTIPPENWAQTAERLYRRIPAAPEPPKPVPGPVHQGARLSVARTPRTAREALDLGIEEAS